MFAFIAVPMFINKSSKQHHVLPEGSNVTLDCEVTCFPSVTITWTGTGSSDVPRDNVAHPTLSSVQPNDSGNYTCEVTNKHGMMTQRRFQIDITGKLYFHILSTVLLVKNFLWLL